MDSHLAYSLDNSVAAQGPNISARLRSAEKGGVEGGIASRSID
jgi:hypothetical protein